MDNHKTLQVTASPQCPNCHSRQYVKNGKEKHIQRYKCKACRKSYRDTNGSALHNLHKKDLVAIYIQCIHDGCTLRNAAKITGISLSTSFTWRHRFLNAMKQTNVNSEGTVLNVFIIKQKYSQKGNRKPETPPKKETQSLICINELQQIKIDHLPVHKASKTIKNLLQNVPNAISEIRIEKNKTIAPALTIDENRIIQTNNKATNTDITQKLTLWLEKFRGVATKYLQHYWNWYQYYHEDNHVIKSHEKLRKRCLAKVA